MENMAKRLLWTLVLYAGFALLALGFAVTGVVFGFKSLLAALTPIVGPAWAYLICSGVCVGLILLAYAFIRSQMPNRKAKHHAAAGEQPNIPVENLSVMIREHPFEAVALAFTLGFAAEYSGEFRQVLVQAGSKAIK